MTNDARRTRGDAWAWLFLSLFGSSSGDDGTSGGDDERNGKEADAGARTP